MRTLSIMAFASFLVLWGVYSYLKDESVTSNKVTVLELTRKMNKKSSAKQSEAEARAFQEKRQELDQIGAVINEENVEIDHETRDEIKVAKKTYDVKSALKEKQTLLEQSFLDKASSLKDIKRLQNEIVDLKYKTKQDISNTEKWDPKFIYYLMIQENYSFSEINAIRSLSENGLNPEEVTYINEQIKDESFKERIQAFKNGGETSRSVASLKKKPREKDDFIDAPVGSELSAESKLIEMNYNQDDKEEMVYGNN